MPPHPLVWSTKKPGWDRVNLQHETAREREEGNEQVQFLLRVYMLPQKVSFFFLTQVPDSSHTLSRELRNILVVRLARRLFYLRKLERIMHHL